MLIPVAVAGLPIVLFVVVLADPAIDGRWENNSAHFWLVLLAAVVGVALGYAVSVAARRRRDARLFLVSLAFVSAAAFLGLHALAKPSVLLGKNAGFGVLVVAWAVVSLAEVWPLSGPLGAEQLDGWQVGLAAAGVVL